VFLSFSSSEESGLKGESSLNRVFFALPFTALFRAEDDGVCTLTGLFSADDDGVCTLDGLLIGFDKGLLMFV
jgi:hypothetical protein